MATSVTPAALGESVTEGIVTRWLKAAAALNPYAAAARAQLQPHVPRPAGQRPVDLGGTMCLKPASVHIPGEGMRRGPDLRFRRSEAPSRRVWQVWQVKDSNLRSFRDGFTDRPPAAGLRKLRIGAKFRTHSARLAGSSRRQSPPAAVGRARTDDKGERPPTHRRLPLNLGGSPADLGRSPRSTPFQPTTVPRGIGWSRSSSDQEWRRRGEQKFTSTHAR
jgi:hypothetical protein